MKSVPIKTIPNITVHLKCEDCGHEQDVTSAAAHADNDGKNPHYYFGSGYDFCDECDGMVWIVEGTLNLNIEEK